MSDSIRVRFAPSPTGDLHVGNARSALFTWLFARHHGGRFILRIEDTDRERLVPGSVETIQEDLRWLGLTWDEGPSVGGDYGPYVQSQRLPIYAKYAEQLVAQGHAYRCYCTRERLEEMRAQQVAAGQPVGYDRRCRDLSPEEDARRLGQGMPYVVRIKMPLDGVTSFTDLVYGELSFENALLDDYVAIKSDGFPTYNFANVVDDHLMQISHVLRADEFISSTPRFIVAYRYLGFPIPKFAHLPMLLGPDRSKLGKRHGATSLRVYREEGYLPEAMVNFLALLGWSAGEDRELYSRDELIERFTLEGVHKTPAVFDIQKLEWMNGVYIRALGTDELADKLLPFLQRAGLLPPSVAPEDREYVARVAPLARERIKKLSEAPALLDFFFREEIEYDPSAVRKWLSAADAGPYLLAVADALERLVDWSTDAIEQAVRATGEAMGRAGGKAVHPVRTAVTGRMVGPGLFETIHALGRNRCVWRLRDAAKRFAKSMERAEPT